MKRCFALLLILLVFLAAQPLLADEGKTPGVDLWVGKQGGYFTYRIPVLLATQKGSLLAFCEGRRDSAADQGDNDLLLRRSTDNGATWSPSQLLLTEPTGAEHPLNNPTAVQDRDTGRIWLLFIQDCVEILEMHSDDDGLTWSKPVNLTAQVKQPEWPSYVVGPGIGVQLSEGPHRGRLVVPAYYRFSQDKRTPTFINMIYSDDHGKTWHSGQTFGEHVNENQIAELPGGKLLVNARNHWHKSGGKPDQGKVRIVARSDDGGESWSPMEFDKTLIEPTCMAALLRYSSAGKGKSRLLFSNPASTDARKNMTVRLSYDDGKTWPVAKLVDEGSTSYSALARLSDGRIGLLYEREKNTKLTFTTLTLDWLTDGRDSGK